MKIGWKKSKQVELSNKGIGEENTSRLKTFKSRNWGGSPWIKINKWKRYLPRHILVKCLILRHKARFTEEEHS